MRTTELQFGEKYELRNLREPAKYLGFDPKGNASAPLRFATEAGEEVRTRIGSVLRTWEAKEELDRRAVQAIEERQENYRFLVEYFAEFGVQGVHRRLDQPLGEREVRIETADDRLRCVIELSWDTFMDVVSAFERRVAKAAASEEAAKVKVEA